MASFAIDIIIIMVVMDYIEVVMDYIETITIITSFAIDIIIVIIIVIIINIIIVIDIVIDMIITILSHYKSFLILLSLFIL